ncbi:MAG: DUF3048 domain-containing protein [Lachnospiraceae bacterium]|nr:DUF3048 domain-containing protein [Lachnospiraceae bacterium]
MKKRFTVLAAIALSVAMLTACGSGTEEAPEVVPEPIVVLPEVTEEPAAAEEPAAEEPAPAEEEEPEEVREGYYRSELTGEWIDESLKDQRPIAVMIDNEITALPHYGTSQADIVYEMMNSTQNDRVTRFMVLFKDWEPIERLGSVRSTRPTNIILAPEYNAILCHDGGPYHNDAYWAKSWAPPHLNGIFKRFDNGKPREFTEYVTSDKLTSNIGTDKISRTYDNYWGDHFRFSSKGVDLSGEQRVFDATKVDLSAAFKHNRSTLTYDESTGLYVYNEYAGSTSKYGYSGTYYDAGNNESLAFTNVILQCCDFNQLDDHGYLIYNVMTATPKDGYYLTGGKAIPIIWDKTGETELTKYYNTLTGEIQKMNVGKTYIAIVPQDYWDEIIVE